MTEKSQILTRMNDVGISLSVAAGCEQKLNKVQLQKFVYLADVVGYLFEILPPPKAHVTYKRGPFDVGIQNAVDALVFRGLVEASGVRKDSVGNVHAIYGLTSAGGKWIDSTRETQAFSQRWEASSEVGAQLEVHGWSRLVALVYAEPTFISTKAEGFGQKLALNDGMKNSAANLFALLDTGLRSGFPESTQNRELMVQMLFRYLDRYSNVTITSSAHK
jgi:hypothetical protein